MYFYYKIKFMIKKELKRYFYLFYKYKYKYKYNIFN